MLTLSPSDARKQFFHLGEMAAREPLLIAAATPFVVTPVETLYRPATSESARDPRHVDMALLGNLGLGELDFPVMNPVLGEPEL